MSQKPILIAVHTDRQTDLAMISRSLAASEHTNALAVQSRLSRGPKEHYGFAQAFTDAGTTAKKALEWFPGSELGVSVLRDHCWFPYAKRMRKSPITTIGISTRYGPIIGGVPFDVIPADLIDTCREEAMRITGQWEQQWQGGHSDDVLRVGQFVGNLLLSCLVQQDTKEESHPIH